MSRKIKAAILAASFVVGAGHQLAGQQADSGWRFSVVPYFWAAGLKGDVGIGPLATHVDLSFGDVVDALKFAFMIGGEARYKSYLGDIDLIYISVGDETSIAFRGDTGTFKLSQKEWIVQPQGGYRWQPQPSWSVDGLVGLRYWNLNTVLDVDRTRRPTTNQRSDTQAWVDATGGARVNWMPAPRWRVNVGGDLGGGGSKFSWQAYGLVGGDIASWFTLSGGYRALSVDYDKDRFLYDVTTQGLIFTFGFRF